MPSVKSKTKSIFSDELAGGGQVKGLAHHVILVDTSPDQLAEILMALRIACETTSTRHR